MEECLYTLDQLLEIIPKMCKEQRLFLKLSQKDVIEKLAEKGIVKDQSKISMYESGKILFPDFSPEYCSLLDIYFLAPVYRKGYIMKQEITRTLVVGELEHIKERVEDILYDMGYCIDEYQNIEVKFIKDHYCAIVEIPIIKEDDIIYLSLNYIFVFTSGENTLKLGGRMEFYQIFPMVYTDYYLKKEVFCYLDSETADYGEMALYLQDIMEKYSNALNDLSDDETIKLLQHNILAIGDVYVYESERKKGCFTSMMNCIYNLFGNDVVWIGNTSPVYLKENCDESITDYSYPEKVTEEIESQINVNIEIVKKFGKVQIVFLDDCTDGLAPYAVYNKIFCKIKEK